VVWINSHLEGRNLKVADLERDLVDGVKLVNLIELLSGSISQMLFFGGGGACSAYSSWNREKD
jgi:hypothetical protein